MPSAPLLLAPMLMACAAFARAQDDEAGAAPHWPADSLPSHLAADDAREVAWAGWLVQRDRVHAAVPAVRRALARLGERHETEGLDEWHVAGIGVGLARLHLLDALIQLDVRLPGEELLPHAACGMLRVPALILAARSPEVNAAYFAARMASLDESPDIEWRVCGNLLAAQHDPRFVARCMREFEFRIEITVRDAKVPNVGAG